MVIQNHHRPRDPEQELLDQIVQAAEIVHQRVLAGQSEDTWRRCLVHELSERGLTPVTDVPVDALFRGTRVPASFRLGLVVADRVVVEVKVADELGAEHEAQLATYLRASGYAVGLVLNFGANTITDDARRVSIPTSAQAPTPGLAGSIGG
ncbi:MAG TPA: GxxExxY protein [Myxococcota bacterium]|nr:GxxExxY protein [Myxococcota bacterium]